MTRLYQKSNNSLSTGAALGFGLFAALSLFLLVPITQLFEPELNRVNVIEAVEVAPLPPPPVPEMEPPSPPEAEKAAPPKLQSKPPRPTLEQLEVSLNPGLGGDLTIGVGLDLNFQIESAEQMIDLFGFDELDAMPRIIRERGIIYPRNYRASRGVAHAKLLITVDSDGSVRVDAVLQSTHPELNAAMIAMAKGTRFSNPLKNGQPVRATYEWPLIIPLGR